MFLIEIIYLRNRFSSNVLHKFISDNDPIFIYRQGRTTSGGEFREKSILLCFFLLAFFYVFDWNCILSKEPTLLTFFTHVHYRWQYNFQVFTRLQGYTIRGRAQDQNWLLRFWLKSNELIFFIFFIKVHCQWPCIFNALDLELKRVT